MADIRLYLLAIAHREIPPWLRREWDADDAVQDTLIEAWLAGKDEKPWMRTALLNNIRNAVRNALARITGRRRRHRPWWEWGRYPPPQQTSREPDPQAVAMLNESLARLTPRQQSILLGDNLATKGSHRMVQARAREKVA